MMIIIYKFILMISIGEFFTDGNNSAHTLRMRGFAGGRIVGKFMIILDSRNF